MNQMEIFKNPEFGAIRAVEIDGEPWLVGKDVSLALGYTNPQKAIRDHVDAEDRTVNDSFTVNGTAITLINESGLYSLVLSSKLPKAKQFRRWVTSEVLPTIRKHGAYMTREKLWEVATSPEALLKLCSELLAEREENAVLREENALLEGKAAFFDLFIDMKQSTNLRTTAKELVVPERRFVRFLLEQRFVYRTASGNVLPYSRLHSHALRVVLHELADGGDELVPGAPAGRCLDQGGVFYTGPLRQLFHSHAGLRREDTDLDAEVGLGLNSGSPHGYHSLFLWLVLLACCVLY